LPDLNITIAIPAYTSIRTAIEVASRSGLAVSIG